MQLFRQMEQFLGGQSGSVPAVRQCRTPWHAVTFDLACCAVGWGARSDEPGGAPWRNTDGARPGKAKIKIMNNHEYRTLITCVGSLVIGNWKLIVCMLTANLALTWWKKISVNILQALSADMGRALFKNQDEAILDQAKIKINGHILKTLSCLLKMWKLCAE